jgi:hypothetical protein
MKKILLAAVTILGLGGAVANAQSFGHARPAPTMHQGPYDNTGSGPHTSNSGRD